MWGERVKWGVVAGEELACCSLTRAQSGPHHGDFSGRLHHRPPPAHAPPRKRASAPLIPADGCPVPTHAYRRGQRPLRIYKPVKSTNQFNPRCPSIEACPRAEETVNPSTRGRGTRAPRPRTETVTPSARGRGTRAPHERYQTGCSFPTQSRGMPGHSNANPRWRHTRPLQSATGSTHSTCAPPAWRAAPARTPQNLLRTRYRALPEIGCKV